MASDGLSATGKNEVFHESSYVYRPYSAGSGSEIGGNLTNVVLFIISMKFSVRITPNTNRNQYRTGLDDIFGDNPLFADTTDDNVCAPN